jgi:hypothetical protein
MNRRLQSVLADLHDRYGATAADLSADELEALVFACKRVDNPFSEINAELMEQPIHVCKGVWMWPLTAGAAVWLTEYASKWWKSTSTMYRWAQAYALVHGRDEEAFVSLITKWKARAAILKTALSFCCHAGELNAAIDRAYGVDPYHQPRKKSKVEEEAETDFAALVARLEVASGIPSSQWLWGRSLASMMKSYVELSTLAAAAMVGEKNHLHMELDEAIENLARICAKIGERLRERNEESN